MSALYVPTRSAGTRRYGLVGHVGQSSILVASRDGPKTKVQPYNNNLMRTERCLHRSNGGALDATYQKTSCHRRTLVGAKKSWIQRLLAGFRLIHVVRHAAESGSFPKSAHTGVIWSVTRDRALRARRWVPSKAASAENYRRQGNVQTPITRQVGAVASGVTTFLLAPSTLALALATKVFVAPATSRWRHSVIVVKSKRASNAATKMKRRKAIHGLGRLTAAHSVGGCSIVELKNIGVRRGATHSQRMILTVPALPTW
jgi:hypothetical protein